MARCMSVSTEWFASCITPGCMHACYGAGYARADGWEGGSRVRVQVALHPTGRLRTCCTRHVAVWGPGLGDSKSVFRVGDTTTPLRCLARCRLPHRRWLPIAYDAGCLWELPAITACSYADYYRLIHPAWPPCFRAVPVGHMRAGRLCMIHGVAQSRCPATESCAHVYGRRLPLATLCYSQLLAACAHVASCSVVPACARPLSHFAPTQ